MGDYFIAFKVIDIVFRMLNNHDSIVIKTYPYAFPELRLIYFFMGIVIPLVIGECFDRCVNKFHIIKQQYDVNERDE